MPKTTSKSYYKRRSNKKKQYYKPMPVRRNNIFWRRGMKKAMRVISLLNVEFKQFDTGNTDAIDDAGTIYPCSNVAQGDSNVTRDGSSLKVVGLQYSLFSTIHASATSTMIRAIALIDRQTNGATFSVGNVISNTNVFDFYNLDYERRFVILNDSSFLLSQNNPGNFKNWSTKLEQHLRYNNAAGAITSLTESSIAIILISNEETNTPTIELRTRIMFVDN
jgi:hypothetical protein